MKRKGKILLAALAVLILAVVAAADYAVKNILPYSPIRPHRVTRAEIDRLYPGKSEPGAVGLDFADFPVRVDDSLSLRCWFVFSKMKPSLGTVLLLHGIADSRVSMIAMARSLARRGFHSVLYDSRANGESGGLNCTFGFNEKQDLSAVMNAIQERFPDSAPFAVYGNSLGAAVAIQALAIEPRLRCGVVESCFATLREIIRDYFRRKLILPLDFITDAALRRSERIAQFAVDDVKPEESARRVTQPVMVIHGVKDAHISAAYGRRVYDSLASTIKVWMPISEGTHYNLGQIGGERYREMIVSFIARNIVSVGVRSQRSVAQIERLTEKNIVIFHIRFY